MHSTSSRTQGSENFSQYSCCHQSFRDILILNRYEIAITTVALLAFAALATGLIVAGIKGDIITGKNMLKVLKGALKVLEGAGVVFKMATEALKATSPLGHIPY